MKMLRKRIVSLCMALLITSVMTVPAIAKDPHKMDDKSWISLSGTVTDSDDHKFMLDYGHGTISVEMDHWNWDENYQSSIREGDTVRVYGRIDDQLFDNTAINASSVYDENSGTYFYADSKDNNVHMHYDYWIDSSPITTGLTTIRGKVTSVDGRHFTIDRGERKMTVSTLSMPYNPMDNRGYQKIEEGDRVSVTGHMDRHFWHEKRLSADTVVTLSNGHHYDPDDHEMKIHK